MKIKDILEPLTMALGIILWVISVIPILLLEYGIRKPLDKICDWLIKKII